MNIYLDAAVCLLFICSNKHVLADESVVQCPCSIQKQLFIADCSARDLNSVPECVPNNTKQLLLPGNNFANISNGSFERFTQLDLLNLDNNQMDYLHGGVFKGLHKLKTLSLAHNLLKHNDSFSEDVFSSLHSIRSLYIHGNCNSYPGWVCTYPHKALSTIPSLSFLFLDGVFNSSLGEGFKALKNLHTIKMDSDVGFCNLDHIPRQMFWNLRETNISHIELNNCEIRSLFPHTFTDLQHLETLIITTNRYMSSDGIINITRGLNSKKLKTLILTDVFHDFENTNLPADMFTDIRNSKLETLDLSGDNILLINPECVFNLPKSLKHISLRDNIIGDVHFLNGMYTLANLELFDLSFQNYYSEEETKFQSHHFTGTYSISRNFHSSFHNNTDTEDDIIKLPPNIKTILMNNIKLGYPVPPLVFGPNKLRFLNASACMLKAFLGPWLGLDHLETLDLSHNDMSVIIPSSFSGFRNLTSLYLQGNKIGSNILIDLECKMFSNQDKLEMLDLSDNGFRDIPKCLFESLRNLKILLLVNNALTTVTFQIDSLVNLRTLNLSHNELVTISDQTLSEFDKIAKSTELSLDISGNRLSCGCKQTFFVHWLITTKVQLSNKDNISCEYENKTKVNLTDTKKIAENLTNECFAWIIITACAVTFVGMTLVLGFVVVICHKKSKYMYLFRIARKTLNPYHKMRNEEVTLNIDAYISYDQDFEVFDGKTLHQIIVDRIYPALREKGLRIKIREELGGNQILSTEISEQLQHCHKVVIFRTEEFCEQFANSHEFHVAAMEGIYTSRKTIIPVLVGKSVLDKLLPEMQSYLKSEEIVYFPSREDQLESLISYLETKISSW